MERKAFTPTPEQKVQDAVANSRLSGYEVTEDVKADMLRRNVNRPAEGLGGQAGKP